MFTGLIEEVGTIAEVRKGGAYRLAIRASVVTAGMKRGESVAVSGPCLTVEEVGSGQFWASLLPETAERTTLGALRRGDRVNLERPLRMGDRLGGHLVAGHADGVAEVAAVRERGETRLVELVCPEGLERYLVDQGSVALDGVSLTVREPVGRRFAVALIGTTLAETTLGELRSGDRANIEADLLGKHVEKLIGAGGSSARAAGEEGLMSWLAESER